MQSHILSLIAEKNFYHNLPVGDRSYSYSHFNICHLDSYLRVAIKTSTLPYFIT